MTRLLITALSALAFLVPAAPAAAAGGGLSVSPAFLEAPAQPGPIGSLRVTNGSDRQIAVSVKGRPWLQARSGAVTPNLRRTLAGIDLSVSSFTLAPGQSRTISAALARRPAGGSLYGALEVLGVPQGAPPPNGVLARYRLLSGLRLNPVGAVRQRIRVGRARQAGGASVLSVRNQGNTVRPLTGSVRISGPAGTLRANVAATRILPGKTVDVKLRRGRLQPGTYSANVQLKQGGRKVATVTRRFKVR